MVFSPNLEFRNPSLVDWMKQNTSFREKRPPVLPPALHQTHGVFAVGRDEEGLTDELPRYAMDSSAAASTSSSSKAAMVRSLEAVEHLVHWGARLQTVVFASPGKEHRSLHRLAAAAATSHVLGKSQLCHDFPLPAAAATSHVLGKIQI